jgi:hypothetical protein
MRPFHSRTFHGDLRQEYPKSIATVSASVCLNPWTLRFLANSNPPAETDDVLPADAVRAIVAFWAAGRMAAVYDCVPGAGS